MRRTSSAEPMRESAADVVGAVRELSVALERWRAAFARQHHLAENDSVVMSMLVDRHNTLRPRDVCNRLGVTTGTLTPMLDRLESRGFLQRHPNPQDRRSSVLSLTSAGRQALADARHGLEHAVSTAIDPADHDRLIDCLTKLTTMIDDLAPATPATDPRTNHPARVDRPK